MIGETGERKSAVATPDGKSRKKKKKVTGTVFPHLNMPFRPNLFRTLSSWGSINYKPSAHLL